MPAECLLFFGKDDFVKRRALRDIRSRLFPNGQGSDLNAREWDAQRDGWADALDFLRTSGFLSDKRLAILRNVDAVKGADAEQLLSAVGSLPSWAVLVMDTAETQLRKNEWLQRLSQTAKPVACHAPFEKDLPGWVMTRAREAGLRIDPPGARLLIGRVGRELGLLDRAVETLALFVHPRKDASSADVEKLFEPSSEEDVFGIMDRLVEGDGAGAIAAAERVLGQGGRAPEVLAVLAGQMERMSRAQVWVRAGRSPVEAAAAAGVHPFFRDKFAAQLRQTDATRLQRWMRGLLEADESVKSGTVPDRLALERFLTRESSGRLRPKP